jgi:predicted DNA-binding transcriptional regulator AlpA
MKKLGQAPALASLPPMLNRRQLTELVGLSYVTIWTLQKQDRFPLGINVAPGDGRPVIRWDTEEVLAWWRDQRDNGPRQRVGYKTPEQCAHTRNADKRAGA